MVLPIAAIAGMAGGIVGYRLRGGKVEPINLNQVIDSLRNEKPATYQLLEIDATQAHDKKEFALAGNTLIVLDDTSDTSFTISLNEQDNPQLPLSRIKRLEGAFFRIFVTNDVGTVGTLSLIAGKGLDIDRSELVGDHSGLAGVTTDDHHAKVHADQHVGGGNDDISATYQLVSEKGQVNGYAELDSNGDVPDAQIPSAIARDSEVTSDISTHAAEPDPHTGYQKESEKAANNGYASLDSNGDVPDAQIPSAIARDSEVAADIATHAGEADPHTGYQKESEKGANNGYASLDENGDVPDAQIPAAIARDSEVTTEIATHAALPEEHHEIHRPMLYAQSGASSFNWCLPGFYFATTHDVVVRPANNQIQYVAIWVEQSGTYDRIGVYVAVAAAASETCRLGIYNAKFIDGRLAPGTLVLDAGTVAIDATGHKEITISETLARGYYFLAWGLNDSTCQMACPDRDSAISPPVTGPTSGINIGTYFASRGDKVDPDTNALEDPAVIPDWIVLEVPVRLRRVSV